MNIPEIYLVEPYNAYAPKGKKKHLHQILEEEALMAKIVAEQMALREAAAQTGNTPNVLPPQAPPTSQATAQGYSGGAGAAGGPNTTGGGGGAPRPQFFNPNMRIVPSATPTTASVPATVQFYVTGDEGTLTLGAVDISWNFGDGTTAGGQSPSHTYVTEDNFLVQFTASSIQNPANVTYAILPVTISAPALVASFVPRGATVVYTAPFYSASASDTITFTPSANPLPVTYAWSLTGATPSTSTAASPSVVYGTPGTFTATLTVSDAYGDSVVGSCKIQITPSLLVATIASPPDMDTGAAPLTETFVNGTFPVPAISLPVTWKWTFNSGSIPNQATIDSTPVTFDNPGTFVVKLEATGSDGQKSATSISVVAT